MPIWWSEWYYEPEDGSTNWAEPKRLAVQAASMIAFASSGAATALYWNPQAKEGACRGCLWDPKSGSETKTAQLLDNFVKWFPAGAPIEDVSSSEPSVKVLAQPEQLLLVNTTDGNVTTTVDGKEYTLKAYEIKWSAR
ncbi:hypothetical protein ACFQQB_02465 [Nonomuraea rubra]